MFCFIRNPNLKPRILPENDISQPQPLKCSFVDSLFVYLNTANRLPRLFRPAQHSGKRLPSTVNRQPSTVFHDFYHIC